MNLQRIFVITVLSVLSSAYAFAQTAVLSPVARQQFFDANGKPLNGGKICTYAAGTTTPLVTYASSSLLTPNANPVVLDAGGFAGIWLANASYKFIARAKGSDGTCATGTVQWTVDGIYEPGQALATLLAAANGSSLIGFQPTSGTVPLTVQTALNRFLLDIGYNSFASACGAATGQGKTLAVTQGWNVPATVTCAANLWFLTGGKLTIATAQALTLTGTIAAPSGAQIFDASTNAGAVVLFPTPKQDTWTNWFGADPSGGADSAPAVSKALAAACSGTPPAPCGSVTTGIGDYLLNSSVVIPTNTGVIFSGSGLGTVFHWGGNNSTPMFSVQSCYSCVVKDFKILANVTTPLLYGIQQINSTATPRATGTQTRYSHIFMEGVAGYITTGIYWGVGTNTNNDQSYVEHVAVNNYSHSAFTLNNTQVVDTVFEHDVCDSFGQGQYCVEALRGTFQWRDGDVAGNYVSDFLISPTGKVNNLIENGSYEGSKALITTLGPSYTYSNVSARNVNFSGECTGATQAQILAYYASGTVCPSPGGSVISYLYAGTLSVEDSSFGTGLLNEGITAAYTVSMQNFGAGSPSFGSFLNVAFYSNTNTTVAGIFPNAKPTNISSLWYDGAAASLPLEYHPATPAVTGTWVVNSATQTFNTALTTQFTTANTIATTVTNFGTPATPGALLQVYCNDSNTTWQKGGGSGDIQFEGGPTTSVAVVGKMYVFAAFLTKWVLTNK